MRVRAKLLALLRSLPVSLSIWLAWVVMAPAAAHPAPNSILRLDFRAETVGAELLVPVSELALATAGQPSADSLAGYLLHHLAAETPDGKPWRIEISNVRATTYLDHDYFRAELEFAPPRGATAGHFVLVSDVVTHEIRNHVVFVVADTELLGALQYPARRLDIRRPLNAPSRPRGSAPAE